jgi:hypothetical protein
MKKEYIIGGLALLGVIGVVSYLRKPKRNSEGFFGATGMGKFASTSRPRVCVRREKDGSSTTYTASAGGRCPYGGVSQ